MSKLKAKKLSGVKIERLRLPAMKKLKGAGDRGGASAGVPSGSSCACVCGRPGY